MPRNTIAVYQDRENGEIVLKIQRGSRIIDTFKIINTVNHRSSTQHHFLISNKIKSISVADATFSMEQ